MSVTPLFCDSFDHYTDTDILQKYDALSGFVGLNTSTFRTGRASMAVSALNGVFGKDVPSGDRLSVAVAYRFDSAPLNYVVAFCKATASSTQCHVTVTSTRKLAFYRGATLIATGTTTIPFNTWVHIEANVFVDNSGEYAVWLNGALELSGSADTQNQGSSGVDHIAFGTAGAGFGVTSFYDDLIIAEPSSVADQMGDCKVQAIRPNGAGNYTDFTPTSGANYTNVDDVTPDGDSTTVASATAGDKDSYDFETISDTGTVLGVQTVAVWRKDNAGSKTARTFARVSSTDYENGTVTLPGSYVMQVDMMTDNPDTSSAWTISDINGAEFGIEIVS